MPTTKKYSGAKEKGGVRTHCRKTPSGKGHCAGAPGRVTAAKNSTGAERVQGYYKRGKPK